ncbi:CoA ester lyase [Bradyrhizobium sp. Leo170]|uniref:HpcH/HpaI aldolase/citrate lyase family protein n=1 Tax=Bradyrhizobium sp. Leo170 TaxID=1571199 RepID=UPI00102ECA6C|nr:CoA ester lyase [Bradyrhizobium sp. Leo170]TAI65597.1 CoA ester lyase [Bradyrhizobium sp. Leo170]
MSFTTTKPRACRIQRSELAVPATSTHFFERAARSAADFIFLDLEDAVAAARKPEAREIAIDALNRVDWGDKTLAVRINGLDTEWAHRDIIEIVGRCPRLDLILVPKVGAAFDVRFVDALLTGLERELSRKRPLGIEILIETTLGLSNVEDIVQASDRLEAVIFGIGDYSIDLRTCGEIIGSSDPRYVVLTDPDERKVRNKHWNDQWHFALARIANACRAHGVRAIDGPFANFGDEEGFRASAERAAALGFEGKWAIHPSQLDIANAVFSPSPREVEWAHQIAAKIQSASAGGDGAFGQGGVLIDLAVLKRAQAIIDRQQAIAAASGKNR